MSRAYTLQDVLRGLQRQIQGASAQPNNPVLLDQLVQADESVITADVPILTPGGSYYTWGDLGTLTLSGNEITDLERTAALSWLTTQRGGSTDGLAVPGGMGVWEAGTNLFRYGQCDSTTDYTPAGGGEAISIDATTAAPFSPQSVKVVTPATSRGVNLNSGTGQAAAAGTNGVGSCYFKGVAGNSYRVGLRWDNTDATTTSGADTAFVATGAWQLLTPTAVAVAAGKTGDKLRVALATLTAADTFHIAHAMLEKGVNVVLPYVATSGGATATRAAGRVQVPAPVLDPTQMWMAFYVQPGWGSATPPGGGTGFPRVSDWWIDSNNRITCNWNEANKNWAISSVVAGSFDSAGSAVQTFNAWAPQFIAVQLTATQVKISVNGVPFVSAARTHGIPAGLPSTMELGRTPAGASFFDGNFGWVACGTGVLSNADVTTLYALGSTVPSFATLGPSVKTTIILPCVNSTILQPTGKWNAALWG